MMIDVDKLIQTIGDNVPESEWYVTLPERLVEDLNQRKAVAKTVLEVAKESIAKNPRFAPRRQTTNEDISPRKTKLKLGTALQKVQLSLFESTGRIN